MYTSLIWLFVIIITFLMIFLGYLKISKDRAMMRELQSLDFSHLVISGIETERQRIARELHDNILPQLRGLPVSDAVRRLCMELMPPDFSRIPLKNAFANLCEQFKERSGIECAYTIDNNLDFSLMPAEHQLHLFRMVQEAFTNIEKHSEAQKAVFVARKQMHGTFEYILICISDDGKGLQNNNDDNDNSALGMKNMKQRAVIIGARLNFISESGNGLMVRIEVPPPPRTIRV